MADYILHLTWWGNGSKIFGFSGAVKIYKLRYQSKAQLPQAALTVFSTQAELAMTEEPAYNSVNCNSSEYY